MFIEGYIIQNLFQNEKIERLISSREGSEVFAIYDKNFTDSSTFVAGAPTLHLAVEKSADEFSCLAYLDLKSSTYTYGTQDVDDDFSKELETWGQAAIWQDITVKLNCISSIDEVIDEISFFTGFNIYILGYASSSEERFEEIGNMTGNFPCFFSADETAELKEEALLVNIMAVENLKYGDNEKSYLIPSVGIEGVELWIGTNPTFYKRISSESDNDEQKYTKKFLFNFIFSRICARISDIYDIPSYSVSKIEKAFIVKGIATDKLFDLLEKINYINKNAEVLFKEIVVMTNEDVGKILYEGKRRVDQLSAFYDERNFVSLIAFSFSDNDEVYRQISVNLIENVIPKIMKSVSECKEFIDLKITKFLGEMERK